MARMPVATLRIWEQRHQAVKPATAASGYRLYSPADVQRVMLLRQLTEYGHSIGSLAALDSIRLQQVAEQVSIAFEGKPEAIYRPPARKRPLLKLAVVGPAFAARLQRTAVVRHLTQIRSRVAIFESLAEAAQESARPGIDVLILHAPELRPEALPELQATQRACGAERVAVVYRFAGSAATRALAAVGVATLREPPDDDALGVWLESIAAGLSRPALGTPADEAHQSTSVEREVPPRRYDDAALTAIAGLSPSLACECPRHVAELLMQLSSFEAYSAGCINRDSPDAQLHAYLQQVAAASRAMFESALERVAHHEGLPLR